MVRFVIELDLDYGSFNYNVVRKKLELFCLTNNGRITQEEEI